MMYCPLRDESRGCEERYCKMWVDGDCVIKNGFAALARLNSPVKGGEI